MYNRNFKRTFDIIISLIGAVILLPLFIVICLCSAFIFKGKIFFRQKRLGYQHRVFIIFKFRTMLDLQDDKGIVLPDNERVNSYGLFLRKFSLDEIPQIFNILKGDISIVGPRPLLVEYFDYYSESELVRHSVKPGLTGLAQVKGRNSIKWSDRFEYDIFYVHHQSLAMDFNIIILTILHLLRGQQYHFSLSLIEERKDKSIL